MKHTLLKCLIPLLMHSLTGYGQTATFSSDFEDRNTDPEIGGPARIEIGTSGGMYVVPNPHPDARNSSDYVLKHFTEPGTGGRAEYTVTRHETNEKKYIYTWKRYHPAGMFKDIDIAGWVSLNQWKTWPCEYYGTGVYDFSDEICYGGGIFNDMRYEDPGIIEFMLRAAPNCNVDFYTIPEGYWNAFVLEIYWTETNNGYYRIWLNDKLFGYSDNIKTLFDGFIEETCDVYWSNGLYTYWEKTGNGTADSLIAYLDDVVLYDVDRGYTISGVCPDCEVAPSVPTDSIVYRINVNHSSAEPDGYNNFIVSWRDETNADNISSIFGQSNGIDVNLFGEATAAGNNTLVSTCFPEAVIKTSATWNDTETHQIALKNLNPANTFTFKLLAATSNSGATRGTQIWTTEENRDTVYASGNTCDVAVLKKLVPDANGDMIINVRSIDDNDPRAYINSIEIVEYTANDITLVKNIKANVLNIFPNPVNDKLFVKSETVPDNISIYSYEGKRVKYVENSNTINVSDLKKGIYIVLIDLTESFKILKE